MFYSSVVNTCISLTCGEELHFRSITKSSTSSSWKIWAISLIFKVACIWCLPLWRFVFLKWCRLICAKQIPVMIISVCLSWAYIDYLLLWASIWSTCRVVCRFKAPSIAHHKLEIGITVYISWDMSVILKEFIDWYLSICLGTVNGIMMLLKSF